MAEQTEQHDQTRTPQDPSGLEDFGHHSTGPKVRLHEIDRPGAYVCHWNGDLLRVVEEAFPQEEGPQLPEGEERQSLEVTRISDNPFIPISEARLLAANFDIEIRF